MRLTLLMLPGLLLAAPPAHAATKWQVDSKQSEIRFEGKNAGRSFSGAFDSWTAAINFDPADLKGSKASVDIDLASARTDDKSYDAALPGGDWFNVAQFRHARFVTTEIRGAGPNAYTAEGLLVIRGASVPVTLPFTLVIKDDVATMTGRTSVKRLAWGIGKGPDPTGDWVSLDIPLTLKVVARKAK